MSGPAGNYANASLRFRYGFQQSNEKIYIIKAQNCTVGKKSAFFYDLKNSIFAPKLEDFLEYFILKSVKKFNFPAKNRDSGPKIELTKYWKKVNFDSNFRAKN